MTSRTYLLSGVLFAAFFFFPSPLTAADFMMLSDDLWKIETNLPSEHPCADWGGVWRGWCMHLPVVQGTEGMEPSAFTLPVEESDMYPPSSVLPRRHTVNESCVDILEIHERRACYRAERARMWGLYLGR